MPVSDAVFKAQFGRLADNYLSGAEGALVKKRRQLYSELLARHDSWIDDAVFTRAAQETLDTVTRFLPGTAEFLAICEFVKGEIDRAGRKALPPPAPAEELVVLVGRPSNATLLRHAAVGILRRRYAARGQRALLSDVGGDVTSPKFDEEEIRSVLDEMTRRQKFEALRALPDEAPPGTALRALLADAGATGAAGAPAAGEWPGDAQEDEG